MVKSILDIEEVDGTIGIQFELGLRWFDSRLTFYNLKKNRDLNTLTSDERHQIWIPQVVFDNTKDKAESLNDQKSFVTVQKAGSFIRADMTELQNSYIYKGKGNPMTITRVYSLDFLCEFDMAKYPFDTQVCSIVMAMKGNTGEFTKMLPGSFGYSGPIDLVQYFVKDYTISNVTLPAANQEAILVEMVFGRRVLSTMLTIYLPMFVLCLVSFSTNYFKAFFFEAIVTVNLTALLVQTTLFISISESLPKTNYIKMMDIWCIFNLFVPFCEVIIQTYMDQLREDIDRNVNHHGKTVKVQGAKTDQSKVVPSLPVPIPGDDKGAIRKPSLSYPKDLIARNEHHELEARKDYYEASLVTSDPRKMRIATKVARVIFPSIYFAFMTVFFTVGMTYYSE